MLGLGDVGRLHAEVMGEMPEYVLVAVADPVREARDGVPAADVARCEDLHEALDRTHPDVVVVATPPALHADAVKAALRAQVHVYCEKPLALTGAEAASLADEARARGRRLYAGMQWRHRAGYAEAREAIAAGVIGEVRRCEMLACDWYRSAGHYRRRSWRGRWAGSGGGVVMSQAIHQLDVLDWLIGAALDVRAVIGRAREGVDVEDQAVADVQFASGATGRIVARSTDFMGAGITLVHGERGTIELTRERVRLVASDVPVEDASSATGRTDRILGEASAHTSLRTLLAASHRAFLRSLADPEGEGVANARAAVRAVELVNGIYYSALRGESVRLPAPARDYSRLLDDLDDGTVTVPRIGTAYLPAVTPGPAT